MQTKNVNQQQQRVVTTVTTATNSDVQYEHVCQILSSSQDVSVNRSEVEGDVSKRNHPISSSSKSTPPPYRMPPHPLYNDHAATGNMVGTASSNQQIHTHSSKFPIEREVTLSNCDKNSKVSILNDYRRKNQQKPTTANGQCGGGGGEYPSSNTQTAAWTDDSRPNRTYTEIRNVQQCPVTPDNPVENHRVYKTQLPILETTNGTEPSPIPNQDDSNGFANYSKITPGRSQSTPETECTANNKAFPSRTYQTIRDMISSRFNKSKSDQTNTYAAAASLNNDENNEIVATTQGGGNKDETLSPNSQLVQRGVFLANHPPQQQNLQQHVVASNQSNQSNQQSAMRNTPNYGVYRNPHDIKSPAYRERAVDVGNTAGLSQHINNATPSSAAAAASSQFRSEDTVVSGRRDAAAAPTASTTGSVLYQDGIGRNLLYRERLSKVPAGSRQPVFDPAIIDTPNRYGSSYAIDRHSGRGQMKPPPPSSSSIAGTPVNIGSRLQANGKVQSCSKLNELLYQQQQQQHVPSDCNDYYYTTRQQQQPVAHGQADYYGSSSQLQDGRYKIDEANEAERRRSPSNCSQQIISSDTKYDNGTMERCNIPRAKSNDHLLSDDAVFIRRPIDHRAAAGGGGLDDAQLLMKSKSFENLSISTDSKKHVHRENGSTDSGGGNKNSTTEAVGGSGGGHSDSGRGSTIYSSTGGDKIRRNGAVAATATAATNDGGSSSGQDSSEPRASITTTTIGGNAIAAASSLMTTSIAGGPAAISTGTGKDSPWVDIVETELKQILEPKTAAASIANSTPSEDETSTSPPLQAGSPDVSSDELGTRAYKHKSALYSTRPEQFSSYRNTTSASHNRGSNALWNNNNNRGSSKDKSSSSHQHHRLAISTKTPENRTCRLPSTIASSSVDLESMLDEENNSSEENISTADTRAIRKQLEGLENMYSEVLKLLGVRKSTNGLFSTRHINSDARIHKRRLHGSVSSLPSSVSSRPLRDRYRKYHYEEKKKPKKDMKNINKRFQTLESHVITLARSVAHLSSEMRTQHLMFQEINAIQNELASLRAQTNLISKRSSNSLSRTTRLANSEQVNSSPDKVKKLTKFFGDEPPLLRLFLRKLGYEKYATLFEKERIGLVELPYMSEERLHKLGIPMGPRLRILQEAQLGFPGANENTLCIV